MKRSKTRLCRFEFRSTPSSERPEKDLFDKQYVTGVQTISANTLGTPFTNITAPRFWGVELGAHF